MDKHMSTNGGVMVRLKAERLKRKWSQQDLAFHAHMASADISRIERGWARPYPGQAQRLAAILGIQPEELLQEVQACEYAQYTAEALS
jgi:ribosome-binding protein aMBF1 (putative translation factor)